MESETVMKPATEINYPRPEEPFSSAVYRWTGGRLSSRSGYYAGRGVMRGDLNESHLQLLWEGINKDFGPQHADNFVHMVSSLTDMSATAFLVAFESFYCSGCALREYRQGSGDGMTLSGRGEGLIAEGFGAIMSGMMNNTPPEYQSMMSEGIKLPFISAHGVQSKVKKPAVLMSNGDIRGRWDKSFMD